MLETVLRCNDCGGSRIEIVDRQKNIGKCLSCGAMIILPQNNENAEIVALLNDAYLKRISFDFDMAIKTYELALEKDSNEIAAYEGILLAKYGIEYVKDSRTGKLKPTCHRAHFKSIFEDEDYKSYIELCNDKQKEIFVLRATEIDKIQKAIERQLKNEVDFDVFISYKDRDINDEKTEDSVIARDIFNELTRHGYKTFFAEKTLENRIGEEYEPIIFKALHTAKVFILVGSLKENIYSPWVRNEWSRYIDRIKDSTEDVDIHSFFSVFKNMNPYDFPKINNRNTQGVDASKIGYINIVCDSVDRLIKPREKEDEVSFAEKVKRANDVLNQQFIDSENKRIAAEKRATEESLKQEQLQRDIAEAERKRIAAEKLAAAKDIEERQKVKDEQERLKKEEIEQAIISRNKELKEYDKSGNGIFGYKLDGDKYFKGIYDDRQFSNYRTIKEEPCTEQEISEAWSNKELIKKRKHQLKRNIILAFIILVPIISFIFTIYLAVVCNMTDFIIYGGVLFVIMFLVILFFAYASRKETVMVFIGIIPLGSIIFNFTISILSKKSSFLIFVLVMSIFAIIASIIISRIKPKFLLILVSSNCSESNIKFFETLSALNAPSEYCNGIETDDIINLTTTKYIVCNFYFLPDSILVVNDCCFKRYDYSQISISKSYLTYDVKTKISPSDYSELCFEIDEINRCSMIYKDPHPYSSVKDEIITSWNNYAKTMKNDDLNNQ